MPLFPMWQGTSDFPGNMHRMSIKGYTAGVSGNSVESEGWQETGIESYRKGCMGVKDKGSKAEDQDFRPPS